MKKILIIEDKKAEADAIAAVIRKAEPDAQIQHVDNIAAAYEYAFTNKVSIFIVDIVLEPKKKNDTAGLDFVEKIRKYPDYKLTPIIFITSLEDRRLYAYENLHCYKYLQKPLFYKEVEKIIKEVLDFRDIEQEDTPVKLKNEGVVYVIPQNEITYACSSLAKMKIFTDKDCFHTFYMSCNDLMQQLNPDIFVKCNRNTIINRKKISAIDMKKNLITLMNCEEKIKMGKVYKNDVTKEI